MNSKNYDHLTETGIAVHEGTTVISLFDYSAPRISSSENQTPTSGMTERGIKVRIIIEDFCFLGCNIVQLGRELSTFRRNLLLRCLWQPWIGRYIVDSTKLELSVPTRAWRLRFWWSSGFQYFRHIHKVTKGDYCLRPACLSVHPSV